MGFTCGIVGLPNVGKTSLFNALTATATAEAANYPFSTVEPNVGRVSLPDERLTQISDLAKSAKITPTQLDFVDIAGLVRGASQGEGLGNQFLGHIREVEAIAHVVRCFEDENISHGGSLDPVADVETVETELMIADMESLERRTEVLVKKVRGGDKDAIALNDITQRCLDVLRDGKAVRDMKVADAEKDLLRQMQLLTTKPVMYACNVNEEAAATGNNYSQQIKAWASNKGSAAVIISAAIEAEIAIMTDEAEKSEFLDVLGLKETGLRRVIRSGYELLNLITYFTAGPKETRAWTVPEGTRAQEAAGKIHTDFARGFICAETIGFEDYITHNGEQGSKEAAKMRKEGRDYIVKDGDIILYRFNV